MVGFLKREPYFSDNKSIIQDKGLIMKNFIQTFFIGQRTVLFVILFAVTTFMFFPFSSCSPNNQNTAGSTVDNNPSDDNSGRRRSDPDEDCDEDEGDPCKDSEDCMIDCANIYNGYPQARTSCQNRGEDTVAKLVIVHNRLMGSYAKRNKDNARRSGHNLRNDLEDITDDERGVGIDEFKCYLQIGAGKYIEQIQAGLAPSSNSNDEGNAKARLIETLKWFVVHNKDAAEILDNDLNSGDEILENLLLELVPFAEKDKDCLSGHEGTEYTDRIWDDPPRENKGGLLNTGAWRMEGDKDIREKKDIAEIRVRYWKSQHDEDEGIIHLKSGKDRDLFTALSCFHSETFERNIFSYSAKENNEHIFNLALSLLTSICAEVTDESEKQAGCARALMCWTSWQNSCSGSGDEARGGGCMSHDKTNIKNTKLWEMLDKHYENELENGNSEYNDCTAEGFADFF